jgi:hypothetical protein
MSVILVQLAIILALNVVEHHGIIAYIVLIKISEFYHQIIPVYAIEDIMIQVIQCAHIVISHV